MERFTELTPALHTPEASPNVIQYPGLVNLVQLSAARQMNMRGSLEATHFSEVLDAHTPFEREEIMRRVGAQFDDELINFVTASLIGQRTKHMVIMAEASAGVDGYLPWEERLQQHVTMLDERGILRGASVQVERYSDDNELLVA